jgi:LysM repeat protein
MSEDLNKQIEDLKHRLRQKRNAAQAGIMVAIMVAVFSAGYLYMNHTMAQDPNAEDHEMVISGDSLRHMGYTIEEQTNEIEEQRQRIDELEAQIETSMQEENGGEESEDEESYLEESEMEDQIEEEVMNDEPEINAEPSDEIHIVAEGESLWGIASQHYGDGFRSRDLAAANGLSDPGKIIVGETLTLVK